MSTVKNKLITKVIGCFIALLLTILLTSNIAAADYEITDYTVNANISENGNMLVQEYLTYRFSESMNGVYRDILYKYAYSGQKDDMRPSSSRYQAAGVENIKVYTSDTGFSNMQESNQQDEASLENGMSGVYSVEKYENDGYRKNIKVYTPVSSGSYKYVKYEYNIINAVATYRNSNELFWNFLGKNWECYIQNLNVTINWNEDFDTDKIFVYPHSYANISGLEISPNKATFKVSNISEGTAVDARVVIPRMDINNTQKYIDNDYDYNELAVIEKEADTGRQNYFLSNKIFIGIAAFTVLFLIYFIAIYSKNSNKGKKFGKKLDYYRDIPKTYRLGEYSLLNNKNVGFLDSNLVMATIMDLSEKGFLKLESEKKAKKMLFGEPEYEYYVTLNVESELDKLDDYEKKILKLLFSGKDNKNGREDDSNQIEYTDPKIELNKRFKELSKSYSKMAKNREELYNLNKEYVDLFYEKPPKKMSHIAFIGNILILIALAINIFVISPLDGENKIGMIAISAIFYVINLLFCIVCVYNSRSIKPEHIKGYNELMGLKKYLKDYSVIKQRYPIEIALWGKYLVFATLLGIADKVSKEFKEELLKQGYNEDYIYSNFIMINMTSHYTELSTSMAAYTGSSSSGGYGGGGSGGGGGGGRRRRRILGT